MSDKMLYIAYVKTTGEFAQLLRYIFEYPIVEYWAEPEEQAKLKEYFKQNHYTHYEPIWVEQSEAIDYMPYKLKEEQE